jgi:hypothetical protein
MKKQQDKILQEGEPRRVLSAAEKKMAAWANYESSPRAALAYFRKYKRFFEYEILVISAGPSDVFSNKYQIFGEDARWVANGFKLKLDAPVLAAGEKIDRLTISSEQRDSIVGNIFSSGKSVAVRRPDDIPTDRITEEAYRQLKATGERIEICNWIRKKLADIDKLKKAEGDYKTLRRYLKDAQRNLGAS